ncbi:DNA alkylation repair protein [bacterium]|nr:MAG: DNA alkylation repair protein [bacterium]
MSIHEIILFIETQFEANRNDEDALFMANYMKGKFPFYGIKSAPRRDIIKQAISSHKKFVLENRFELAFACMDKPEREWHQAAVDIVLHFKKLNTASDLVHLERLVLTHSWWDTVDMLAINIIGLILFHEPNAVLEWISRWRNHESMWLNRTAIIFQLKFKEKLDTDLLADLIAQHSGSKEFFIQKAIGWILREYSKTNPVWVRQFVESHPLKPLSAREALRLMKVV